MDAPRLFLGQFGFMSGCRNSSTEHLYLLFFLFCDLQPDGVESLLPGAPVCPEVVCFGVFVKKKSGMFLCFPKWRSCCRFFALHGVSGVPIGALLVVLQLTGNRHFWCLQRKRAPLLAAMKGLNSRNQRQGRHGSASYGTLLCKPVSYNCKEGVLLRCPGTRDAD